MKIKKGIILLICLIMGFTTISAMFEVCHTASSADNMFESLVQSATSLFQLNRIIELSVDPGKGPLHDPKSKKKDREQGTKWMILSMRRAVLSQGGLSVLAVLSLTLCLISLFWSNRRDHDKAPPGNVFYMKWRAAFIDPVRKCINCLAGKYANNPIITLGGLSNSSLINNPHFV